MKTSRAKIKRVAVTTGDLNGVGLEVAVKALLGLNFSLRRHKTIFFLFRAGQLDGFARKTVALLDKKFSRFTFSSLESALTFLDSLPKSTLPPDNVLIDLELDSSPADWVVVAAENCLSGRLHSLVTGPLSKGVTAKLGRRPLGHTGIFRKMLPQIPLNMAFVGRDFNVLLATDHMPLQSVEKSLMKSAFRNSLLNAGKFRSLIRSKKKIGVLGLNPHAGERGLIGNAEKKLFRNLDSSVFDGPLVPDAAFLKNNRNKYCLFLCLYHDQGLIPFKAHHGQDSGVHITMGLPFVRTSVDHGTANDIYGKNIANPASMLDAIKFNLKLIGVRNV